MLSRKLAVASAFLISLTFAAFAISKERSRSPNQDQFSETSANSLERRVDELEKQVKALSRDLESLRREAHPSATRPAQPKPISRSDQSHSDR